jgi:hypothetical protein
MNHKRAQVNYLSSGLEIVIPSKRNFFVILTMGFWLTLWFMGAASAFKSLIHSPPDKEKGFLIFWLCGWTFGGACAAFAVLWNLAGREIISISQGSLKLEKKVFGLGISKEYSLFSVRNFRFISTQEATDPSKLRKEKRGIAFDFNSKTIRFAKGLNEVETKEIFELLKRNYNLGH